MPYDDSLAARVRNVLHRQRLISEKRMFGGLAFMLAGNMCVGVWHEFLVLRVGPERAEALLEEAAVRTFDITGKPMRGWVMVEPAATLHEPQVLQWCQHALAFAKTLPAK